jgi:hypothetical protein
MPRVPMFEKSNEPQPDRPFSRIRSPLLDDPQPDPLAPLIDTALRAARAPRTPKGHQMLLSALRDSVDE